MNTVREHRQSGKPSSDNPTADAARLLRSRGFALCKPDPAGKAPTYAAWCTRSSEPDDYRPGDQIGCQSGALSDGNRPGYGLVITDLDTLDAIAAAPRFLPPTRMIDGRPGKPDSHRYYLVPFHSIPPWGVSGAAQAAPAALAQKGHAGPFLKHFRHRETGRVVIDFLGTGGQVVCPPSLHPSGERRAWVGGAPGEPAVVDFLTLWLAVCDLAAACGCTIPAVDHPPPPPARPRRYVGTDALVRRAAAYLNKYPPAVSKQGGHSRTMYAARVVVWEFDLGPQLGFELLRDIYNPKCDPPWSDAELWHKVNDADTVPFGKPRGWRRDCGRQAPLSFAEQIRAAAARREAARRA